MPRALFPVSPPPPGGGIFDSITNISPTLLNAAVLPRSPTLFEAISSPPPPDDSMNAFPFSSQQLLPQSPAYKDVLNENNDKGFSCVFSSPQRLDYSVLDNVSTEWRAPSFELLMNKDPHGLQPIVVDLHKFIQQNPDTYKRQFPEKDDWLYFPPSVVPTTYTFHDGKKKISQRTNLSKYLNDTSCIENGFTVMSNGSKPSQATFADSTHKYHKYTIQCCVHGRTGRKNPNKKQKRETKGANTCSDKCKFEIPVFHDVDTGRLYVRANGGGLFQHNGHSFAPREHTKDSLKNIPRPSLGLAIKLIEKMSPITF
jgi:hypothetical protein